MQKLHAEIAHIGNDPEFRKTRLTDIGIVPVFDTPEHLAEYLKEQRAKGALLIQGIRVSAALKLVSQSPASATAA